ncbi:MAG: glycosyltransferase family 4 protein, partial [Planctomycetes bacterium]|nr:glycosyltransferase family 4 protein [Planctomycetota bacterium]
MSAAPPLAASAPTAALPVASAALPRLLLFTRDDPAQATGGVETFTRQLLALFPGSEAIAYGGAAGRRLLLDEARDARAARATVLARLAARRADLVVANGAAAWALGQLPVPRITVLHGTYAGFGRAIAPVANWRGAVARHYGGFLERRATRGADAVVAVSASVAEQARTLYGVDRRLAVIENGVAVDATTGATAALSTRAAARAELGLAAAAPLLLFVGRGEATKGFDLLLELARRHPEWRFAAAGVDPEGAVRGALPA